MTPPRHRHRRSASWLLGALLVFSQSACAAWEPDLGPAMVTTCDPADTNPDVEISFKTDVYDAIIQPMCLPCHDPTSGAAVGFTNAGLDLTSLAGLRAGGKDTGLGVVVNGNPCSSHLLAKVVGAGQRGSRMPLGAPPLDAKQIQVIHDWIAEGARDN